MAPRRLLLGALLLGSAAGQADPASVLASLKSANAYFLANTANGLGSCGWTRATYLVGNAAHYAVSQDPDLLTVPTASGVAWNWTCTNIPNGNNDLIGSTYLALYNVDPAHDPVKLSIEPGLAALVANTSNIYEWYWVDALFMALPTYLEFGTLRNDSSWSEWAMAAYTWTAYYAPPNPPTSSTRRGLWAPDHGLFYRDATYFNKTSPNGSPVFWGRGNGWAMSCFARALAALPPGHPHAAEYRSKLVAMAYALLPLQGTDGLWRSNLLDADEVRVGGMEGAAGCWFTCALSVVGSPFSSPHHLSSPTTRPPPPPGLCLASRTA